MACFLSLAPPPVPPRGPPPPLYEQSSSLCFCLLRFDWAPVAGRVEVLEPQTSPGLRHLAELDNGRADTAYKRPWSSRPPPTWIESLYSFTGPTTQDQIFATHKRHNPSVVNTFNSLLTLGNPKALSPLTSLHSTCVDNIHRMAQSLSPDSPHHDCRHLFYSRLHHLSGRSQRRRSRFVQTAFSSSPRYVLLPQTEAPCLPSVSFTF